MAAHTDEVADIEQLLKYGIVQLLVLARTDFIACDVNLYAAVGILELGKGSLAHDAAPHDTAGHTHLAGGCVVGKRFLDFAAVGVYRIFGRRIRLDAHVAQSLQRVAAYDFLFAKFENVHVFSSKRSDDHKSTKISPPLQIHTTQQHNIMPQSGGDGGGQTVV